MNVEVSKAALGERSRADVKWLSSRWFWALVLWLVAFAVWSPVLGNEFTFDDVIVIGNERLRTWGAVLEVFRHPYNWGANLGNIGTVATYRPVELASYVLGYRLWGLSPLFHHLMLLLVHLGVQTLAFLLFCRWFGNVRLAFAVALLAAIHPACREAMSAPSDLFVALFGLAAVLVATSDKPRRWHAIPAGLLFICALVSKESGGLYLLLSLAFAEVERRRAEVRRPLSSLVPLVCAVVVAFAVYAVLRSNALGAQVVPRQASLLGLLDAVTGVWYHATQAFLVPLNRVPAILDFAVTPPANKGLWYLLVVVNLAVLSVLVARRRWMETIGFSWWLVSLMPSAMVTLTPGAWPGLYRWIYIGTPGLLLALTGGLRPWLQRRGVTVAWGVVCCSFAILSVRATLAWKNDVTLFGTMTVETPDNYWSYRRLGWALYYRARYSQAIPPLERCAELAPADERDSCFGLLAASMAGAGDCDGAVSRYVSSVPTPIMPMDRFAHVAGLCYERRGNLDRARQLFRACSAAQPRCRVALERLERR